MKKIDPKYQEHLQALGHYKGRIDGWHGKGSIRAVKDFQWLNGLTVDGVLGPKTRAKINESMAVFAPNNVHNPKIETPKPSAPKYSYTRWPKERMSDLQRFYGRVGQNQTRINIPYTMKLAWDLDVKVDRITCHVKVAESLQAVLEQIASDYSKTEIKEHGFDLFGGCLNVRKIRGGNRWSTHAWGIAIDLDPARNGLRTPWNKAYFSKPECAKFVQAFKNEGWYSLGAEKNFDAMHFQACYR